MIGLESSFPLEEEDWDLVPLTMSSEGLNKCKGSLQGLHLKIVQFTTIQITLTNSGIISYTSFFQHTFDSQLENQEIVYHCEIHPWRTAKVSVSGAFEQGHNFVFASGTGQVLNMT